MIRTATELAEQGHGVFDSHEPIYRQIADQIRQDVVSGELQEEEQVMSTTQYAASYKINPATAAKAFSELVDEGVLYMKRGLGTFVCSGAREQLLKERRERFFGEALDPVLAEAQRIGIPMSTIIEHLVHLEHLDRNDGLEDS